MTTGAFTVGGAVQAGADIYVERKADRDLIELCGQSQFAYVLAPRQMGKSSLMIHTVRRLKQRGIACVTLILTSTDVTPEQWYRAFLIRIADQLSLRTDPQQWWAAHADLSFSQRFKLFLQERLPAETAQPVVIFIDEIELTLGLAFADDFFGALRSLYDERAATPALARISFVLLGATSPAELVKQPNRAPFNVGHAVAMTDFTLDEAQQLAQGFGASLAESKRVLGHILDWTGGHPYLTQCLCAALLDRQADWDRAGIKRLVLHTLFESSEAYSSNLQEVQRTITRRAEDPYAALMAYRTILRDGGLPDNARSSTRAMLKLSGIVEARGGRLEVRNRIYRAVFDEEWVQEQLELLPNYLPRRILHTLQYAAYVLLVPLIVLAIVAGWQWYRADKESESAISAAATAESAKNQAQIARKTAAAAAILEKAQRQSAESAALALHALARYQENSELSLRMVLSAADRGWSPPVDQAMRQIMQPHPCVDLNQRVYDAVWPAGANPTVLVAGTGAAPVASQNLDIRAAVGSGGRPVMLSRDGSSMLVPAGADTAQVIDAYTNQVRADLHGTGGEVRRAVWSPDGSRIITIAERSPARIWKIAPATSLPTITTGAPANAAAWTSDSQRFALAGSDGIVRVWSIDDDRSPVELSTQAGAVIDLEWSPDRAQLAAAYGDGVIRIWDVPNRKVLLSIEDRDGPIRALRWSPKMHYLLTVSGSDTATARVWEAASGAKISILPARLSFAAAAWSADERRILIASTNGKLGEVCIFETREEMLERAHVRNIQSLSEDEEQRLLADILPTPLPPTSVQTAISTPMLVPSVTESPYPPPDTNIPNTFGEKYNEPVATTVVPESATAVPELATAVPEPATTVPEPATTVPEAKTVVPEPATTVPEAQTVVPEPATAVPEAQTVVPEAQTVVPEPATTVPEPATAVPTDISLDASTSTASKVNPTNTTDSEPAVAPTETGADLLGETPTLVDDPLPSVPTP
jgi:hypothetical protein